MSEGEFSVAIIKSEPCDDEVPCIINTKKAEYDFLDEVKSEVDVEYITEDIKEQSLMEVKQEEAIIKDEIPSSSDTQNDLKDNNAAFTQDIELSPTSLKTETNINTGVKQFACTFCQYKTSWKRDLKRHIDHHKIETPASYPKFQCAECEYETHRKIDLVCHMVIHTGEERFTCNVCEFRTDRKDFLKSHMMKHTGEKPFLCNLCEFKTARKSYLKCHLWKHTGEKPFFCNLCEYKTAQKGHLKSHMMKHTGEKPFNCNLCEFKTAEKII